LSVEVIGRYNVQMFQAPVHFVAVSKTFNLDIKCERNLLLSLTRDMISFASAVCQKARSSRSAVYCTPRRLSLRKWLN